MSEPETVFINVSESPNNLETFFSNLVRIDESKFSLKIDCKYYTADVIVRSALKTDVLNNPSKLSNVHGMIIFFDGDKVSSWNDALAFMRLAVEHDVSIRLLVCHTITPSALLRSEPDAASAVIHTVLDHVFELVEISPAEDTIEEDEEYGVKRIKSVFEAYMWPNMKLKEGISDRSKSSQVKQKDEYSDTHNQSKSENHLSTGVNNINLNNDPEASDSSTCDEDNFEDLFKQLPVLREELASLNSSDRYKMAEKITCKIWRAIGGSEEEIAGLHSDSD
uniref:Alpha-and gamma-adaptin-binding protein p34 n=1 Tax=Trichobilharzia regenti TaxID=157069 RepID=A0AA85J7S3_TRIRE|nr:unnamed protein product [Trichobilharzia regenti]